jgi:hypothetical protein
MRKKVLSGLFALALLATAGYGVNQKVKSNANLSDLALANVEALAGGESGGGNGSCKWKRIDCPGWGTGDYEGCLTNGDGNSCTCGAVSRDCK